MKYNFSNDYSELIHPEILQALIDANKEQNIGYGLDQHSIHAEEEIKKVFSCPKSSVYFVTGGTQANMVVISYLLRPYEGVLSCQFGHINVHETAAVEGSGHKVFTEQGKDGKLSPEDIEHALKINQSFHMVKIKMVYVSNTTEVGTLYTKKELTDLYHCCQKNNLYLFIDGARLASALTSSYNDVKPEDISHNCDVFYIGGTKIGMLSGEAIVINQKELQDDFRYQIKNKGAMLAKGFVLGIQFEKVFQNGLYWEMGKYENDLALYLAHELENIDIKYKYPPVSNQLFINLSNNKVSQLQKLYGFEINDQGLAYSTIRIVISWATPKSMVDEFIKDLISLN